MKELLSEELFNAISSQFSFTKIEEIRLRANCPVVICSGGTNYILKRDISSYYIASDNELNYCISRATQNSLYAMNDQIKQMYISYKGGVRIGLTGEVVENSNKINTIKYINSINIRIPHQVKDFASMAISFIKNKNIIHSTLIVSPPGVGKTTLLRDLCRLIGSDQQVKNILLVDERFEIANCIKGRPILDVGIFTDIISGGNKQFAFNQGIRSLKPNVIITDELGSEEDITAVASAIEKGVSVIASIHAKSHLDLVNIPSIKTLLDGGKITRIIVLSEQTQNRYLGIYDNKFSCLYMPY